MKNFTKSVLNIIDDYTTQNKCIFIIAYSQGYCELKNYDEEVCLIYSTDKEEIIDSIVNFIKKISNGLKFEFNEYFQEREAYFQIDGYKNILIKNNNLEFEFDFSQIEKIVYDKLILNGLQSDN